MKRESFGRVVACVATALLLGSLALATCSAHGAMADCYDATCRVSRPGGIGTGVVFEVSQGQVFILTNAHVATTETVACEFWRDGHQSIKLPGKTIMRHPGVDAALVVVLQSSFGGILPTAIPIAPRGTILLEGDTICSAGCAKGAWVSAWKGHVIGYDKECLAFLPIPAQGRSGSAIFDAAGESIVGLICEQQWSAKPEQGGQPLYGRAVTLENLYRALGFTRTTASGDWRHNPEPLLLAVPAQCGPGGCPSAGGCPSPGGRVLPYRENQDRYNQQQDNRLGRLEDRVWPTLPQQQAPPPPLQIEVAPKIDVPPPPPPPPLAEALNPWLVALVISGAIGVGIVLFYCVGDN